MSPKEANLSYLDKENWRDVVFNWLLDARYWLGVLVGQSNEGYEIRCEELEFRWYINRGVRISIGAHGIHSRYAKLNLSMVSVYGRYPFEYRLPEDLEAREHYSEIEGVIQRFFPGIHCANTWAICEIAESEYCLAKRDILSICLIDEVKVCWDCKELLDKRRRKEFQGYIYLIGNHEKRVYKIGLSRQPKERYKAFRTKLPFAVEILHQIGTDDMKKSETLLHNWFRDKNTHGEWFELSETDVEFICSLIVFERGKFINGSGKEILEHS